jgi:hypothetical protein
MCFSKAIKLIFGVKILCDVYFMHKAVVYEYLLMVREKKTAGGSPPSPRSRAH